MSDLKIKIIKIAALILAIVLIISSVFLIRSCSAPPDYEEVRERVEQLIEDSYVVNDIVWGKGLPTYERVTDPKSSLNVHDSELTYTDSEGNEKPLLYLYYYTNDEKYDVIGYREQHAYTASFSYAFISGYERNIDSLERLFPLPEGDNGEGKSYYSSLYFDRELGAYAYSVPYVEPEYDFYYTYDDPYDYDFVTAEAEFTSIEEIKAKIRTVYAESYAESLEAILFDGVMEGNLIQKARYATYTNSNGVPMLASLNEFSPLFSSKRVYLMDTAKINRNNSNETSLQILVYSYLEDNPTEIVEAKLSFTLQDGEWFLSAPTY